VGLQIGAKGVDLVMLVMNEKACNTCFPANFRSARKDSAAEGRWDGMLLPAPIGK
jgi:hypothetical protein